MDKKTLTRNLKLKAKELGFSLVGITSPDPPPHIDIYQRWLAAGRHGEMAYLAPDRAIERRADPLKILPECKSILALAIPYDNPSSQQDPRIGFGRVAAYAWGNDYHDVLIGRLRSIVNFVENEVGHPIANRWYTDSGPILEREFAQRAGLGWIGKNTMLINPRHGSYFLLAEILLGVELEFDAPLTTDHCGTCRRCIDACPTNCILEDRTLDAARCISYLTIELKGPIPSGVRRQMGDWIFGCDVCQIVCPWNERFAAEHGNKDFKALHQSAKLHEELQLTAQRFNQKFKSSPMKRTKRRGYLRNVSVAIGNSKDIHAVPALIKVLEQETDPLVRSHAAWALGQIGTKETIDTLEKVGRAETNALVQNEIRDALKSNR